MERRSRIPKPPGFGPKWKKKGKYWVDPKTGERWYYHGENELHWPHWDVHVPGKGKRRIPIEPEKEVFK